MVHISAMVFSLFLAVFLKATVVTYADEADEYKVLIGICRDYDIKDLVTTGPGATMTDEKCAKACNDDSRCTSFSMSRAGPEHMECAPQSQYCETPYTEAGQFTGRFFYRPGLHCLMKADGRSYNGTVHVTKSGKKCQRWDSQTPHQHSFADSSFFPYDGTISQAANYCRNPGTGGEAPWCFTPEIPRLTEQRLAEWWLCKEYEGWYESQGISCGDWEDPWEECAIPRCPGADNVFFDIPFGPPAI